MGTDAAMEMTTGTEMSHNGMNMDNKDNMNMNTTKCGDGMMGMMVRFNLWPCNVYIRCTGSHLSPLIIYAARTTQITCLWPCSLYIRRTRSPQLFILLEQPKLHVCGPVTCTLDVPVLPNYLY